MREGGEGSPTLLCLGRLLVNAGGAGSRWWQGHLTGSPPRDVSRAGCDAWGWGEPGVGQGQRLGIAPALRLPPPAAHLANDLNTDPVSMQTSRVLSPWWRGNSLNQSGAIR